MSLFWLAVVSLHVFAAITWIGGMVFLSLVLAPLLRRNDAATGSIALFRSAAQRFRLVVWTAMALLLTTGPILLSQRDVAITDPSAWPRIVVVKLALVAGLLVTSLLHDLFLGPKVSEISAVPECARAAWEQTLVRTARWLPRLSLLLAFGVIVAAVALARS